MKAKVAIASVLCILTGGVFTSCLEKKEFPVEPIIEYNRFETYDGGAAAIFVNFTDGDGNIGLAEGDTTAPYNGDFYYNFFIDYFEQQNGEWVKRDDLPVPFYYRIPLLTPSGQNRALEGEIKVDMPFYYDPASPYDTIKYEVYLVDRALNISNTVESEAIVKP